MRPVTSLTGPGGVTRGPLVIGTFVCSKKIAKLTVINLTIIFKPLSYALSNSLDLNAGWRGMDHNNFNIHSAVFSTLNYRPQTKKPGYPRHIYS